MPLLNFLFHIIPVTRTKGSLSVLIAPILIISIRILLEYTPKSRSKGCAISQRQQVRLAGVHHTGRRRFGEPLTGASGSIPTAINMTELVAHMIMKEGIDSLLSKISRTVRTASRTYGNIGQFEATFARSESSVDPSFIISVSPLEITNDHHSRGTMISVVAKCLHSLTAPSFIGYPSIVRCKLCEVSN
jgi:hypothetical protein